MVDHSPASYDDAMAHAATLAEQGRLPDALAAYRRVAADHPSQPGPHYEMGILHHRQGDAPQAIASFERAAALMPRDASIWNNLGVLHYAQGDDAKAEQCFRQAVALDGAYAEAWYGLAKASERIGRRGDAVVAFRACLRADASHDKAARCLEELRDAGAGKLKVGFVSLWYERGQAYVTQMLRNAVATEHETFVLARNGRTDGGQLLSTVGEWAVPNVTTHSEYSLPCDLVRQWIAANELGVVFFNEEYDLGLVQAAHEAGAQTIGIYYWELFDPAKADIVDTLYDAVICPTRCSHERFCELGMTRAVHVPWGIDTEVFGPVERPPSERVRFFHPAGWGGLHARRGTQAVIDAFREAKLANAELLVHTQHGEGVERQGNITIRHGTVPREELVRMYQESDVAVLPSKWEGLGLTFLEAMGCGLPIITVDAPPMNEFVVDGETGILCPVRESKRYEGIYVEGVQAAKGDLAAAMARLSEREALSTMRAATLRRASDFAWSKRRRAVLELVTRVAGRSAKVSPRREALRLSRKSYAGCSLIASGNHRYITNGDCQEPATVHLLGARRSNFPWGMENEIYRALELGGYRVLDTDFRQEFGDLPRKLEQPAHLLLAVKANGVPPDLIRQQPCPTVLWYPDDIFAAEHARPQLAYNGTAFDRVYTFDRCAIDAYRQLGIQDVRWLPLAASPALHRRMYLPKVYDVSFVGNVYPNRQRLLDRLSRRFNLLVTRAYTDEMVRIFNQSKITLNLGIGPTGIQLRVFEALASGCFLLTNAIPPESRLFTDREHLVYYRDGDIEDLIAYYLDHEEEREEIAHNGYLEVHAKHTFAHRVETILADALCSSAEAVAPTTSASRSTPVVLSQDAPQTLTRPPVAVTSPPSAHDQRLNVAFFAPSWNGTADELAMAHIQALRARGHTTTLNAIDDGCQAVVAYGDFQAAEALAAAEAHCVPLYCYVLDIPFWRLDEPEHKDHYRRYREVLQRCTEIIALSEQTRGMVREFVGRDARVCHLGFPITELDLTQPEYDVEEANQIALLSRLVPHKHPEVIIEAISYLERRPRLVIMAKSGDRALVDACQAQAQRLGVEVVFKPGLSTDEVARELRRSLFLVSASTFEGFGMSPGEALYCGKPAIVTDLPAFREAYQDHVLYFPAMGSRALANEMSRLLENGSLRRWLGEQGHHYVARHYTIALAAQRLEGLLRAMNAHQPKPEAGMPVISSSLPLSSRKSQKHPRPVVRYAGPIYNVSGYGKACRLNILALQRYGDVDVLPLNLTPVTMDYRGREAREVRAIEDANREYDHDISIYHCNLKAYTRLYEPNKRNLVYTVYESTVLEQQLKEILVGHDWGLVVPSEFVGNTFRLAGVPNRIHIVPHAFRPYEPVDVECLQNLGARFKFYTINNWTPRKNMQGLLHAYFRAFTEDDDVILLIKTFRLDYTPQQDELILQEFAAIRREYSKPPLVCFLFGVWDEPQIAALHQAGDVFVSATHGEAWGLTGFEAMGYGKPVIQTYWSGMMDYMRDDCCYPVREGREDHYTIERPFSAPVGEGDTWFYPDMDRFSELMRHCYQHPEEAKAKGEAARAHIASRYSLQAIGWRFKEVLQS